MMRGKDIMMQQAGYKHWDVAHHAAKRCSLV